ncbi:unnamed protein product, partial [Closterium sp. NIES-53]
SEVSSGLSASAGLPRRIPSSGLPSTARRLSSAAGLPASTRRLPPLPPSRISSTGLPTRRLPPSGISATGVPASRRLSPSRIPACRLPVWFCVLRTPRLP